MYMTTSNEAYVTPKHRLFMRPLINGLTRRNLSAQSLFTQMNRRLTEAATKPAYLISKIRGYAKQGAAQVTHTGRCISMMDSTNIHMAI